MNGTQWRYITPCCETTSWRWRSTLGMYYCYHCKSKSKTLIDKKTDTRVQSVGER